MIDTDKYEKYKPTQANYQTSERYIKELLTEVMRLRDELDNERVAKPYSVSNERLWEQIDRCNRIASESVTRALDIEVKEIVDIDGGHKKYPFEKDSETGRFDMENYEWVNPSERLWLDAVVAEVERLREKIQLLHDTWFTDAEMASDVDERMTELLKEMIE